MRGISPIDAAVLSANFFGDLLGVPFLQVLLGLPTGDDDSVATSHRAARTLILAFHEDRTADDAPR